jgi:hypothetical protein
MTFAYSVANIKYISRLSAALIIFAAFAIVPALKAQTVSHPVSEITTTAKHYIYSYKISDTQQKDIDYIIVKASDGSIKSCFNACDVCYPAHKGYTQKSNLLQCNNCGNKYNIDQLGNQGAGGCWPGHLPHTIEGDNVVIKISDLILGEYFFLAKPLTDVKDEISNNTPAFSCQLINNELSVNMANPSEKTIRLMTLNGQMCMTINSESSNVTFDVSNLSSGLYLITVGENGRLSARTIIIGR